MICEGLQQVGGELVMVLGYRVLLSVLGFGKVMGLSTGRRVGEPMLQGRGEGVLLPGVGVGEGVLIGSGEGVHLPVCVVGEDLLQVGGDGILLHGLGVGGEGALLLVHVVSEDLLQVGGAGDLLPSRWVVLK